MQNWVCLIFHTVKGKLIIKICEYSTIVRYYLTEENGYVVEYPKIDYGASFS